eukprot:6492492-Amphidinium_carterae.2
MGYGTVNACTDSSADLGWAVHMHNSWNFPLSQVPCISGALDSGTFGISGSGCESNVGTAALPDRIHDVEHLCGQIGKGETVKPKGANSRATKRRQRVREMLKFATINVRSLLCDGSPGLAETARSQQFRAEMANLRLNLVFYYVTAVSPVSRVGGLQILVAKAKGCKINWVKTISFRVLVAGVTWKGEAWCIVNAYSPTNAAPREEFEQFWSSVEVAIAMARRNGLPLLVGTDLNTRLGGERDDIHIGPAVVGSQPAEKKYRAEIVAASLASSGLAAWTTMIGQPHTTWISPHETPSQIDYVLGVVVCEVAAKPKQLNSAVKIRPKLVTVRSPDHSLAVKLALASCDHSGWQNQQDPLVGIAECIKLARQTAEQAPGSEAIARKEWISAASWTQIRIGAAMRKAMNRSWKRCNKEKLRMAWRLLSGKPAERRHSWESRSGQTVLTESSQCGEGVEEPICRGPHLYALLWALHRTALRKHERTDELAEKIAEGDSSAIHKQVKKCLLKLKPNVVATKRGPLRDFTGKEHTTEDEKQMAWQAHWARLYGGKVMSQTRTFDACQLDDDQGCAPNIIQDDDWFTLGEVKSALRHQMNGKASIDSVPSKELLVILHKMAPVWQKAFNSFLVAGSIPKAYRGTLLFVIPKKTAVQSTQDYRGLQLMLWSAKVFTRALFVKCMQRIKISTGQFGLGQQAGTDYPLLIATQLMEYARSHGLYLAWWFVDVRTAFDRIVRQLMLEPGHTLTLSTLLCLGIGEKVAKDVLRTVMHDTPVLWEQGLSPALLALLSSCMRDTWITLPVDQGEMQLSTGLGAPQGSSLSGLLFILYQQKIHNLITQHMAERGVALVLPSPEDSSYLMANSVDTVVPVLAYHDDSLV